LSINVEHEVNKEADERARKLRSEMIRQRQIEVDTPALPSPEPESSPATNNDEVTFASLDTDTAVEEQQKCSGSTTLENQSEEPKEPEESEIDRYWKTHGPKPTKNNKTYYTSR